MLALAETTFLRPGSNGRRNYLVGRAEFECAVSSRECDVALRGGVVAATAHTGQLSWHQSLSSQRPELARLRPRAEQD